MMMHAQSRGTRVDAQTLDAIEARVADGDREAFAELYDVLAPRVFDDLAAAAGPARAGTLTEALLLDAWEHARRIRRHHASIAAWVLAHARALAAATGPLEVGGA